MDGWMDRLMDGWLDCWMDGSRIANVNHFFRLQQKYKARVKIDVWIDGLKGCLMDTSSDGCIAGRIAGRIAESNDV
jgi:hypothetical protein